MDVSLLNRHVESMHRLELYGSRGPQRHESEASVDTFTIALSREAGIPSEEVAQEVRSRLGWPVYDHELPERIAGEMHCPVAALERMDERHQSWLLEWLEGFGGVRGLSQSRYMCHLVRVIRSLGEKGRCVIVGRGATYILPPPSTLRVRLIGNMEDRITAFSRRVHLNRNEAARRLEEIKRDHNRFVRNYFYADPAKPSNYDMVLNTSQWSVAECAKLILQALHCKAMADVRMEVIRVPQEG